MGATNSTGGAGNISSIQVCHRTLSSKASLGSIVRDVAALEEARLSQKQRRWRSKQETACKKTLSVDKTQRQCASWQGKLWQNRKPRPQWHKYLHPKTISFQPVFGRKPACQTASSGQVSVTRWHFQWTKSSKISRCLNRWFAPSAARLTISKSARNSQGLQGILNVHMFVRAGSTGNVRHMCLKGFMSLRTNAHDMMYMLSIYTACV